MTAGPTDGRLAAACEDHLESWRMRLPDRWHPMVAATGAEALFYLGRLIEVLTELQTTLRAEVDEYNRRRPADGTTD